MDAKVEHLKLIQGVISRLAGNSFSLKGWTVTLVAALFAFGAKEADRAFLIAAWVPVPVFALLDAYFLWKERAFRKLFEQVAAAPSADEASFNMKVNSFTDCTYWSAVRSPTIIGFYIPVAALLLLLTLYTMFSRGPSPAIQGPRTVTIQIQ